jgi:Glyoxalase/Bleomycin resistance protein/Dioxygenase superfamily
MDAGSDRLKVTDFEDIPDLPAIYGTARQVAYIVEDVDAAMKRWHDEHGVGPFLVCRNAAPLVNAYYRGCKARRTPIDVAFAYVGDMQLELIAPVDDTPSMYKEARDRDQTSVHHYAVLVHDFATVYDRALDGGAVALVDAGIDGLARMSYLEDPETGLILEVIERNAVTLPYFDELERRVKSAPKEPYVHALNLNELAPKGAVLSQTTKFVGKWLTGGIRKTRRAG